MAAAALAALERRVLLRAQVVLAVAQQQVPDVSHPEAVAGVDRKEFDLAWALQQDE